MTSLHLDHIVMRRGSTLILDDVSMSVGDGERWLVLGANGSGKTSLLRVAALYDHPTSGVVEVLGERLGRTDVRQLRRRVAYASAALTDLLRPSSRVLDVVRTARFAALEPWWHRYTEADDERARRLPRPHGRGGLRRADVRHAVVGRASASAARPDADERARRSCCSTSRRRASTSVGASSSSTPSTTSPPTRRRRRPSSSPTTSTTSRRPRPTCCCCAVAASCAEGPIDDVLDAAALSECFGLPLTLERRPDGRFSAWARR